MSNPPVATPRRRGRPSRVDREAIIRAALALPPESVNMKTVAESLGVDRSTLNYHVANKDELLALTAAAAVDAAVEIPEVPADADWRELAERFARMLHAALLAEAAYTPYLDRQLTMPSRGFELAGRVLAAMGDAGFSPRLAAQGFSLLAQTVYVNANAEAVVRLQGAHPGLVRLGERIDELPEPMPVLEAFVAQASSFGPGEQFDFALTCALDALEGLLGKV